MAKGNSTYVSKDDKLAVSSYLLIDFEEIDSMKDADLNAVKALVTTETIAERAAYARNREEAIAPYLTTAKAARELGLGLNAGHDLSLEVGSWMEYTKSVRDSFLVSHGGKLLTALVMEDSYEGGAHPSSSLTALNMDLEFQSVLFLEDIFQEDFYEDLRDRIQDRLMRQYEASSMDELEEKGNGILGPVEPTENFILGDESITFIYNPYDIAPYSEGRIEVTLSFEDMADLLK